MSGPAARAGALAAPAALVVGLWVALFWPAFTTTELFFLRDLAPNYYPMKWLQRQAYLEGEAPLWLPHFFGGVPFGADVLSAPYYPLNVLLLLPSFVLGFNLLIAAQYLIAAAGAFFLARGRGVGLAGATATAVAYGLGNLLVWSSNAMHFLSSYAWMPWVLGAFLRAVSGGSRRWLWAGAGFMALQLFAGDPQSAYVTAGLCLLAAAFHVAWDRTRWRASLLGLWPALAVPLLAGALAAVVLVPAAELLPLSDRAERLDLAGAQAWSFHPARLLELWLPMPFGQLFPDTTYWGWHLVNSPFLFPYNLSPYLGASSLALAVLGAAGGPRRERGFWLAALALGTLAAFGRHAPLYEGLYRALPLWSVFRYPERLLVVVVLALSVLAGRGLDRVREAAVPRWWVWTAAGLAVLAGAVWGCARFAPEATAGAMAAWAGERAPALGAPPSQWARAHAAASLEGAGQHAAVFLLFVVGLSLLRGQLRRASPGMLALVVAADVGVTGAQLVWLAPVEILERRGLELALPPGGDYRIEWDPRLLDVPYVLQTELPQSYRQVMGSRATLKPNYAVLDGHFFFRGYTSVVPRWFGAVMRRLPRKAVYDWWSVRYASLLQATVAPYLQENPGAKVVADLGPAALVERPSAFPRQWLVYRAESLPDDGAVLERMRQEPDLRQVVLLAGPVPQLGGEGAGGEVTVVERRPSSMRYRVRTPAPAVLVTNDSAWPGWTAEVDGAASPLMKANWAMRAVAVPAGEHEVVLRYRPRSARIGGAISLAAAVLLAGLLLIRRRVAG